jgi:hypothetical protein
VDKWTKRGGAGLARVARGREVVVNWPMRAEEEELDVAVQCLSAEMWGGKRRDGSRQCREERWRILLGLVTYGRGLEHQ